MRQSDPDEPAVTAIHADATDACTSRLARVAGTHALLLDGGKLPEPAVTGVARWTALLPGQHPGCWQGPLCAQADCLPFEDDSFCAVVVRFVERTHLDPDAIAVELARVIAPHGSLLIADLHPYSLWHAGTAPGHWARALRNAGLEVWPAARCGSPWPRVQGAASMPHWLVRGMGGAWVIEAHRRTQAAIPLRKAIPKRRAVEHKTLLPGARRQCA